MAAGLGNSLWMDHGLLETYVHHERGACIFIGSWLSLQQKQRGREIWREIVNWEKATTGISFLTKCLLSCRTGRATRHIPRDRRWGRSQEIWCLFPGVRGGPNVNVKTGAYFSPGHFIRQKPHWSSWISGVTRVVGYMGGTWKEHGTWWTKLLVHHWSHTRTSGAAMAKILSQRNNNNNKRRCIILRERGSRRYGWYGAVQMMPPLMEGFGGPCCSQKEMWSILSEGLLSKGETTAKLKSAPKKLCRATIMQRVSHWWRLRGIDSRVTFPQHRAASFVWPLPFLLFLLPKWQLPGRGMGWVKEQTMPLKNYRPPAPTRSGWRLSLSCGEEEIQQ